MNIGIDIRTLSFRRGGISQYTYSLLKTMLRLDSANTYLLFNYSKSPYEWDTFRGNAREIILRFPQRGHCRTFWENVLAPMAARRYDIDLWFSPDFYVPRYLRTKSVITICDLIFEKFHDIRTNKLASTLSAKIAFSIRRAGQIIAISSFTRGQVLERYRLSPDKVRVIPLAADERFHKIDDPTALRRVLRRYGIDFDYILYVGEISERKNIVRLVRAYDGLKTKDKLAQRKLVLVGKRTSDTERMVSEVKSLHLESQILFTGYVPDEDLPFLYNGASVFVFPSLYEGFGIPPLEAMQCQVPVVASSATSIPEVVGNGALLFDPYNVEDIADKLDHVLSKKADIDRLLQAGLKQAQQFSWEDSARKTIALLESVAQGGQG
ncbi:MAG TPA: glycosyltransferase family 1 protein [Thermodesulfovibrionales bacterium]|nr:glycosyltransferase family 1 protein [Thermodesulfovibrionales bacterium]